MTCKRMASSTNGAKDIVDTKSLYQKYFIGVVACIVFGTFGHSNSEPIHESSKNIYPLELNGPNLTFTDRFGNGSKNNETCYLCSIRRNGSLLSRSCNYDETVELTSIPSYISGPTNNSSQIIINNDLINLGLIIKSQRSQENILEQDIMKGVKRNEVNTTPFNYRSVKSRTSTSSNPILNNQTRLCKSVDKNIKRPPRKSNINIGELIYLKDPLHSPQAIDHVNSSNRSLEFNLKSDYSNKKLKKRFVGIESSADVEIVINPEYEAKNKKNIDNNDTSLVINPENEAKNKKNIVNNEASHQNQRDFITEIDNNDAEYLDQYESDTETNETLSFVNNSYNSKNLEGNEINRPHKRKGVKQIKQLKIKNSTRNDNKIPPKMHNLLHDIADELLSTNPGINPMLVASKVGIMKRDELNKLNSSDMLMLIKSFVDRELSEYNKELTEYNNDSKELPDYNKNNKELFEYNKELSEYNENKLESHQSDEKEFALHSADISNLSHQRWNAEEHTTIPLNFNIYFFNNNDGTETVPLEVNGILPYIPTISYNDVPHSILRPEDDYRNLLKYGDLSKHNAYKPPTIAPKIEKKGIGDKLRHKYHNKKRTGNKDDKRNKMLKGVGTRDGEGGEGGNEGGGDNGGGESGGGGENGGGGNGGGGNGGGGNGGGNNDDKKCSTEKLVLMVLGSVAGVLLLGIILCLCWKMCHKEAIQICEAPNPCF